MYAGYDMVKLVRSQGETRMKLGRKKFIIFVVPREGSLHAIQNHRGCARFWSGGRRQQQARSLGQSLYFGFHRKGKAGQVNILGLVV